MMDIALKSGISFLFSLFLFFSCATKEQKNYSSYADFPLEKELKGNTVELDTALFRYPFRIRIEGDKAIVMDLHGADHYYHIFQYPGFKYLNSFGRRGDSPEEMLSADNVRCINDVIWTLDANNSELDRFVFSSSGDSLLRDEVVSLDKSLLRVLDFVQYDDSTFIIPDYSGDHRFCWVNRKGMLMQKWGGIPTVNEEALSNARPALAQAWRSFIDYNPRNGVLAAATQLGEVLEIYNLKDSTHIVLMGPHGEPEFKISNSYAIPSGIMGFSDVQVTDRAIYAVFHGRTFKEIVRQKDHAVDGGQSVYVFTLQGVPLCKYTLDRCINGIHVNEEDKIITATDVNNDQPIVEFRIN